MRSAEVRAEGRRGWMVLRAAMALVMVAMLVLGMEATAEAAGESLVLSVSAERVRGGVATPCGTPCQVGSGDAIRYAVTLQNVSGRALNDIRVSAPVPPKTTDDAAASTIPSESFTLITGATPTFIRQVTVNGPPEVEPGAIISFSASATYGGGQAAFGSPASHVAEVVNNAPVAQDDAYVTVEDTPLVQASPGLLVNDTDADGDGLTTAVAAGPANGTVTVNTDGSFTYTPNRDFAGTDTFTYTVADPAGATDTATATITVTPADDLVAQVQQPIDPDGSSVFSKKRGVVPVKFALFEGGSVTCSLPPAQIAVSRISDSGAVVFDEAVYTSPSDTGSSFRREDCTYHYNLAAAAWGRAPTR